MYLLVAYTRIFLLLLSTLGFHCTVTPPNPPPESEEEATSTKLEILIKQRSGPILVKSICWLLFFSESLAIHTAQHPYSGALTQLIGGLADDDIQISGCFVVGVFLATFGGYIRYRCYKELGLLFTFEMSIRTGHTLVTTGPYGVIRHPGYIGVLSSVIGMILIHAGPGSWIRESGAYAILGWSLALLMYLFIVGVTTIALLMRMSKEDDALQANFGQEWTTYVSDVPWSLIPGVY